MKENKAQDKAIEKIEGPCVILAGAGTGKSHTLVKKIEHLVSNGYKPEEILCLTFSNEATNSLKNKVSENIKGTSQVTVKTFHSFCGDILRESGEKIGIDPYFELLMSDDAKVFLYKYYDVAPHWADRYIKTISSVIDLGVNFEDIRKYKDELLLKLKQLTNEDVNKEYDNFYFKLQTLHLLENDTIEKRREIKKLKDEYNQYIDLYEEYKKFENFVIAHDNYIQFKKERNYLDFSDLNHEVLKLFRMFGAEDYVEKYKYVLIDEFQDTNKLQFELIQHIASHRNITVVGDMNQSIYGFRGSYKESFNHFKEHFNVTEDDIFKLDVTYRNTNNISKIAHKLIVNNYEDKEECLLIKNVDDIDGDKVKAVNLKNIYEEARYIADKVEEKIKEGIPKDEIYILHRTHQQADAIKEALELKNIPVISSGRINLLQKREIKTTIAYLSLLNNLMTRTGTGEQAWWDFFHYQNTLSPSDSLKIGRFLKKSRDHEGISIDELLLLSLEKVELSLKGKEIVKRVVNSLRKVMESSNKPLPDLILDVYEMSGLNRAFTYERSAYNLECLMNLKKFHEMAVNFYDLHDKELEKFIEYLEILDKFRVSVDSCKLVDVDAVKLMTIHASKGLEAQIVFLTNMAEKRFPLSRTSKEPLIPVHLRPHLKPLITDEMSDKEIEKVVKKQDKEDMLVEERRLCYVAMTRASKELYLTYASSYNDKEDSAGPSMFLEEIDFENTCEFIVDEDEKNLLLSPSSPFELQKRELKRQLVENLDTEDFTSLLERLMYYLSCREKDVLNFKELLSNYNVNVNELKEYVYRIEKEESLLKFDKNFVFSPSSINTYLDCPKKFELAKLYNMPERGAFGPSAASLGSFVHTVLENGVNKGFKTKEEFISEAEKLKENEDMEVVSKFIDVFWERNKVNYSNSETEKPLRLNLEGYKFFGLADRIDLLEDGSYEIVDYKTGKVPSKDHREIQLGFYALALLSDDKNVSKMTLEMLKCEKPISFKLIENGCAVDAIGRSTPFNITAVKEKLISTAKAIEHDFQTKFECAKDDNKCRYCGYKFYCPKWGEE